MGLKPKERINIGLSLVYILPMGSGALADALNDMLDHAQEQFGPRDLNCHFLSLEFGGETPRVWFSHRSVNYTRMRLAQWTYEWAERGDYHYAFWQLAQSASISCPQFQDGR